MSRFYCPSSQIKKDWIYLKGDEAHHVYNVMRLREKDKVTVFDGSDNEYEGSIVEASSALIRVRIDKINKVPSKKELNVSLAVGLPKLKKMDLIVQKCTELGAKEIIPLETERSLILLNEQRKASKKARWSKIARESAKQCRRCGILKVRDIISFDDLIERKANYDYLIMPAVREKRKNLKSILEEKKIKKEDRFLVVVGPEGGFSQKEIDKAQKNGFILTSLGQRTLRTETAAIYLMSVLSFYLEG
jgi:16S rRNA (uracil1498-N3)-methyltransferase